MELGREPNIDTYADLCACADDLGYRIIEREVKIDQFEVPIVFVESRHVLIVLLEVGQGYGLDALTAMNVDDLGGRMFVGIIRYVVFRRGHHLIILQCKGQVMDLS